MANNKPTKSDKKVAVQTNDKEVNLTDYKSFYYWLNAKPDTKIKILQEPKLIKLSDLDELNKRIQEKIQTHDIFISFGKIDLIFERGRVESYSNWNSFDNANFNNSNITSSISMEWDIQIKIPEYKLPQGHNLRVRIGSSIRPNEFFSLLTQSDNDVEILENTSFIVSKVDFLNVSMSEELLNIVERWHEALSPIKETNHLQSIFTKGKRLIASIIESLYPLIFLLLYYIIVKLMEFFNIFELENISFNGILIIGIGFAFIYYFASNIGEIFGRRIYNKIESYLTPHIFDISNGDKNKRIENFAKNRKRDWKIVREIFLTILGSILSVVISYFINGF